MRTFEEYENCIISSLKDPEKRKFLPAFLQKQFNVVDLDSNSTLKGFIRSIAYYLYTEDLKMNKIHINTSLNKIDVYYQTLWDGENKNSKPIFTNYLYKIVGYLKKHLKVNK